MKAIIKNISRDESDDLIVFAKSIDFSELFEHIKSFSGVTCSFYHPEIGTVRGSVLISFKSEDIASLTGPFSVILDSCCLSSFNCEVKRDRDSGELFYFVSVDIMYEHKAGGSNGMELLWATYAERTGWVFHDVGMGKGGASYAEP